MKNSGRSYLLRAAALVSLLALASCATTPQGRPPLAGQPAADGRPAATAEANPSLAPATIGGVSSLRLAHLERGINLGSIFTAGSNPLRYGSAISERDLLLLKQAGFTFCRLPIDPSLLFDSQSPSRLRPGVRYVDHVVDLVLAAGLSVIIDPIHTSSSERSFEGDLAKDPGFASKVAEYWRAIASRYAGRDPNRVFFEIMNEPHASAFAGVSPDWWPPAQERLARAVRAAAPRNTIIATGEEWGSIDGLLRMRPLPISDVVYSFHYYDPFPFTHQGATWVASVQRALRDLPYPSSPRAVARILPIIQGAAARRVALRYGGERWNIARIRGEISKAVGWADRYHVPLVDGEFGVFKPFAPPADRYRWLHDVRTVLAGFHIGWAMWQYDSSFGLVDYEHPGVSSGLEVDERCLAALGLKPVHPDRPASPIDRFERGASSTLTIPVSWLRRLWTRVPKGAAVTLAPAPKGAPGGAAASIDITAKTPWGMPPNLTLPVQDGERYRLSTEALVRGSASCVLQVVAFYPDGSVTSASYLTLPVKARGRWVPLSVEFPAPQGAARIGLRWSGSGPGVVEFAGIELSRSS